MVYPPRKPPTGFFWTGKVPRFGAASSLEDRVAENRRAWHHEALRTVARQRSEEAIAVRNFAVNRSRDGRELIDLQAPSRIHTCLRSARTAPKTNEPQGRRKSRRWLLRVLSQCRPRNPYLFPKRRSQDHRTKELSTVDLMILCGASSLQ